MEPRPLHDAFWDPGPKLPTGLRLERLERLVARRRGPGGQQIFDLALLQWAGATVQLLLAYKTRVLARDVGPVLQSLGSTISERRIFAVERSMVATIPTLATDHATPSVVNACVAEGLALLDGNGTIVVRAPGVFVHVTGTGKARLDRSAPAFQGGFARVVRVLLDDPHSRRPVREISDRAGVPYAVGFEALVRLESLGLVSRSSPRSGFVVRDPPGLLRAWMDSRRKTAASIEPFYAQDLSPEALARASAALQQERVRSIWTLSSGLRSDEVHVSGLPHGIYLSGSSRPLEQALGLRRVTPHNFLVLRAEAAAETDNGGIFFRPRQFPHGPGVALPQLAIDCSSAGGRGPEQAEFLVGRYAKEVDPMRLSLESAPFDDQPLTAEDIKAIDQAKAETGPFMTIEEVRARLSARRRK